MDRLTRFFFAFSSGTAATFAFTHLLLLVVIRLVASIVACVKIVKCESRFPVRRPPYNRRVHHSHPIRAVRQRRNRPFAFV